jgi:WD40 repeat protein
MRAIYSCLFLLLSLSMMAQKAEIMLQNGHQTSIINFNISPDGSYILSIDDNFKTILWDAKNNKQLRNFDNIAASAFMPDSRSILIVKKDCTVSIIDLMGKVLKILPRIKKEEINSSGKIYIDSKQFYYDNSIIDLAS